MAERTPTIGIIMALPLEQAALVALLDNAASASIEGAGTRWPVTFGTLPAADGEHSVVVAQCGMGNNNAATCATFMLSHFDQLGALLMVGIAGGVPYPVPEKVDRHVRLGDIVVSDGYGVVQYDQIKPELLPGQTAPNIEYRNLPRPPPAAALRAAAGGGRAAGPATLARADRAGHCRHPLARIGSCSVCWQR